MRYAIVDDVTKLVQNAIVWDGITQFDIPAGVTLVNINDIQCGPNWVEQPDGSFSPPVEQN
jgi:hypothetical protein